MTATPSKACCMWLALSSMLPGCHMSGMQRARLSQRAAAVCAGTGLPLHAMLFNEAVVLHEPQPL